MPHPSGAMLNQMLLILSAWPPFYFFNSSGGYCFIPTEYISMKKYSERLYMAGSVLCATLALSQSAPSVVAQRLNVISSD